MIEERELFEKLDIKTWLDLNARLQSKKNRLRQALKEKGILKREGSNEFDRYKYFSESQYKNLFTELLSSNGLELKFDELDYSLFEGTGKNANGRQVKLRFYLYDIGTGFFETADITAEGMDKGDKAGYKADTGAIKYYLAGTFLVATGDDPEKDSPDEKMNTSEKVTDRDMAELAAWCTEDQIKALLKAKGVANVTDLPRDYVKKAIAKAKAANTRKANKEGTRYEDIARNEETF